MQETPENHEAEPEPSENVCASCLNILDDEDVVSALGHDWHVDCFRCSACDVALSNWYFEKDGLLFCKNDYWARYGESCQQCNEVITGPVMVAGEHKFHPECFCCGSCGAFIGDGDSYALVERSKLYCGPCYKRQMQPLKKCARFPFARKPHSIRLVEIPGGQKGIKLTNNLSFGSGTQCFTISELFWRLHGKLVQMAFAFLTSAFNNCCYFLPECGLGVNNDLMSLHIGDKILEINGTPVGDTPIENVENLLKYSDQIIQLTIEHDPDTILTKTPRCTVPASICPLTTTCSDTNIPKQKLSIPSNFGSSDSIQNEIVTEPPVNNDKNDRSVEAASNQTGTGSKATEGKERLFKRKDEGYMSGTRSRQLRRKNHLAENKQPLDKERSSSLSRLLDEAPNSKRCQELSRAYSFFEPRQQRVFRASDLVKGELLGQGFFGQVFKVTTRDTAEVMVVKELYRVDEEAQKNFLKEVAVLRSLHHPNLLRFIGVVYKERRLHLVTEYVPGGTLLDLIHSPLHPLPWEQRVSFARDIAAGMAYLHSTNIIHRDLNSHNCLVREDRSVVVADFGLARVLNSGGSARRIAARGCSRKQERKKRYTVVGNPYWMAPEMMKGNKYDEKVDIFSFGIILCEIIGRVLADPDFLPRSDDFGLNQTTFREKFCGSCPEPFYKIAFLCTDLNPDKRPPFEVMEVWLESLLMHLSVGMTLPDDLVFDILHYRGQSPSSSGSTTPEGIPSGHRSPALEPIQEGKPVVDKSRVSSAENLKPIIKVSSAENILGGRLKPIIKVSSSGTLSEKICPSNCGQKTSKSCEDFSSSKKLRAVPKFDPSIRNKIVHSISANSVNGIDNNGSIKRSPVSFGNDRSSPDYENIDFLRNDRVFIGDGEKTIGIEKLGDKSDFKKKRIALDTIVPGKNSETTFLNKLLPDFSGKKYSINNSNLGNNNNVKDNKFSIQLRKVPKNFTRNKLVTDTDSDLAGNTDKTENESRNTMKDKIKLLGGKCSLFDPKLCDSSKKNTNLSLQNIGLKTAASPSRVTQKFVNTQLPKKQNISDSRPVNMDDFVHKTALEMDVAAPIQSGSGGCKSLFRRNDHVKPAKETNSIFYTSVEEPDAKQRLPQGRSGLARRKYTKTDNNEVLKRTPVLHRREPPVSADCLRNCDNGKSCASGSVVRSIVDSLNRKDRGFLNFGSRNSFGRSSLKVVGNPKIMKSVYRSPSPEEFTQL